MVNININNLNKGQTIKNYKELCNILDIKATTGGAKKNQLKELSLYCDFEKVGNKFIIKEIYKQPTIKIDDLIKTKNSKYIKLVSDVLLEQLYKHPKELEQVPLIKLFTLLGVVNDNYKSANNYRKELSQLYNIQLTSIYYFYSTTRNEFKRIIERCLNNLQKRSVLFWSKCIMIVKEDNQNNKIFYKADKGTEKLILDTQKEVLQYLNFNNMAELMQDKKSLKQFNKLINQELNFNYYFAYDITIGEKAIQIEYENIQKEKSNLNRLMISKSYNLFDKDYYNNFKNDYSLLIKLLIDINCNNEIKEILENKYVENFNNYLAESIIEDNKHTNKLEEIKEKYIDTYIN